MKNYQRELKKLRKAQKLSAEAIASKMSFAPKTIEMLEDTEDLFSLKLPTPSLKNYLRKYAECLEMPEKKIVNMLNRLDYLDYKRSRRGKLKAFDYFNRLIIVILIALLAYHIYMFYLQEKANAIKQSIIMLPSPVPTKVNHSNQPTNTQPPIPFHATEKQDHSVTDERAIAHQDQPIESDHFNHGNVTHHAANDVDYPSVTPQVTD